MKKKTLLFFVLVYLVSCASVRERFDIGASKNAIISRMGNPTYEKNIYEPVPPWAPNEGLATKTMYYKTIRGNFYYYLNDDNIVVNSLYFNDDVRF